MKFIMYKKRTEKEVVEKFKNEDKDLLEETIEKLKELGYINDREYIERFANEAMSLKNLSIFELKYKLYSKGISDSLIDEYIESNLEMLDEYELLSAQNIYDKKKNMQDSQEIILYLRKKRYSPDTIKKLSRE